VRFNSTPKGCQIFTPPPPSSAPRVIPRHLHRPPSLLGPQRRVRRSVSFPTFVSGARAAGTLAPPLTSACTPPSPPVRLTGARAPSPSPAPVSSLHLLPQLRCRQNPSAAPDRRPRTVSGARAAPYQCPRSASFPGSVSGARAAGTLASGTATPSLPFTSLPFPSLMQLWILNCHIYLAACDLIKFSANDAI